MATSVTRHRDTGPRKVVEDRNVLLIGAAGAGKSTLANIIAGRETFPTEIFIPGSTLPVDERIVKLYPSQPADGSESRRQPAQELACKAEVQYKIRLLDTRGLHENRTGQPDGDRLLNHDSKIALAVWEAIEDHILKNGINIHLVLFVVRLEQQAIKQYDLNVLKFFMERLSDGMKQISTLVLTHCDYLRPDTPEERENVLDKLIRRAAEGTRTQFIVDFLQGKPQHTGESIPQQRHHLTSTGEPLPQYLPVGFPKLEHDNPPRAAIEKDKQTLIELVTGASRAVYFSNVIIKPPSANSTPPARSSSCKIF